jgi:protein ImuB
MDLLAMQLERLPLPAGVTGVCLKVLTSGPLEEEQGELFANHGRNAARQRACLIDRLSSRLGAAAVLAAQRRGDALPERAIELVPQVERKKEQDRDLKAPPRRRSARTYPRGYRAEPSSREIEAGGNKSQRTSPQSRSTEPLDPATLPDWLNGGKIRSPAGCLALWPEPDPAPSRVPAEAFDHPLFLIPPEPIEVTAVVPYGPPVRLVWQGRQYLVTRTWGPERIETGWWRGRSVRRDYYRVETAEGEWLWIYRELDRRSWKLHGKYG